VTPEVTRDVCLLARMMAANLYCSQIEDLMFEVQITSVLHLSFFLRIQRRDDCHFIKIEGKSTRLKPSKTLQLTCPRL
jgi:hypothetical protein